MLKKLSFCVSVFVLSLAFGYFIFAWTEPTTAPPGDNVASPINVSSEPQAKSGILTVSELHGWTGGYVIPDGNSVLEGDLSLQGLSIGGDIYIKGNKLKCLGGPGTDDPDCGTIDCSNWYVKTGIESPTGTQYCYSKQDITTNRCEEIFNCKDENTSDCNAQPNHIPEEYSCGDCKYISSDNCVGTTRGNCTNYPPGTPCGENPNWQCLIDGTCYQPCKFVFTTNDNWSGDLGGLDGADQKCQTAAESAGLTGTYKAWLSSGSVDARDRLTHSDLPYCLIDGTIVANNWNDLVDGSLDHFICITETGADLCRSYDMVWTNTDTNGEKISYSFPTTCYDFTSNSSSYRAYQGCLTQVYGPSDWTRQYKGGVRACHTVSRNHLYCFQQ